METARSFLITLFVWMLFAAGSIMFLKNEQKMNTLAQTSDRPNVFEGAYTGTADLSRMSGEQLLGLALYAKGGEFVLSIDGIVIDRNTDLEAIDFQGVPGLEYELSMTRDSSGRVISITATH